MDPEKWANNRRAVQIFFYEIQDRIFKKFDLFFGEIKFYEY